MSSQNWILSSFLLSRVYSVNHLWGATLLPPCWDDIVYGRPPTTQWESFNCLRIGSSLQTVKVVVCVVFLCVSKGIWKQKRKTIIPLVYNHQIIGKISQIIASFFIVQELVNTMSQICPICFWKRTLQLVHIG